MATPTLKITEPSGPVLPDPIAKGKRKELRRARTFLATYYVVLPVTLIYLLFKVFPTYPWPVVDEKTNALVGSLPIYFFRWSVSTSLEDRLLLLVIVAGALGSYIHSATSYADFRGNKQFNASWTLWYVLRPLIGVCLALVLYFATRGGLLLLIINAADATKASIINPFGLAAIAGLTGMSSKTAADKLAEVFTTLFKSQVDQNRKDSLETLPPPVIKSIDPNQGTAEGGTEFTITGSGFKAGVLVSIGAEPAVNVQVVNDTTIKADTPAGQVGPADAVVQNSDGQKTSTVKGYTYLTEESGKPNSPGSPSP